MPLDPGYIDHARRQIDQIDRRLLQGERIPHQEKVFSIFEAAHALDLEGQGGPAGGTGGLRSAWSRTSTSSSSITSCCGKEDDVEVAVPMIEETQAPVPRSADV